MDDYKGIWSGVHGYDDVPLSNGDSKYQHLVNDDNLHTTQMLKDELDSRPRDIENFNRFDNTVQFDTNDFYNPSERYSPLKNEKVRNISETKYDTSIDFFSRDDARRELNEYNNSSDN